jgi:hypothetical protein
MLRMYGAIPPLRIGFQGLLLNKAQENFAVTLRNAVMIMTCRRPEYLGTWLRWERLELRTECCGENCWRMSTWKIVQKVGE